MQYCARLVIAISGHTGPQPLCDLSPSGSQPETPSQESASSWHATEMILSANDSGARNNNNNNNNNIYLKSSIQTSSIDYKKYTDIYN